MVIRIESETERSRRMGQIVQKDHVAKALEDLERLKVLKEYPNKWDDPDYAPGAKVVERKAKEPEKPPVHVQEKIEVVRSAKRLKTKQAPPNSIRFPQDVLDHFRWKEPGWQKRINDALLEIAHRKD